MSTVTEIKAAVERLPAAQKRNLARWLQAQVGAGFSDDEMMAIAAEGAREMDRREEQDAKRKAVKFGKLISEWLPRCGRD